MRFSLKDFQITAADSLMAKLDIARYGAARKQPQAVVLSSPTGSGKTVIITEMIERILRGYEGQPGDPLAVFLWLSDSPELNEQSKEKIEEACDLVPVDRLVTIESPFNVERMAPGRIYFLNTQKLTANSLLTNTKDTQERTIWTIVENTVKAAPGSFYLIIDEAHRGMRDVAARTESTRLTIVQRFVKGDPALGLSPVPLIIGISATPERFYAVLKDTDRTPHSVNVEAGQVRGSGLIKDRIKLSTAKRGDEADWSMLAEAGRKWIQYTLEWEAYCRTNQIDPVVRPLLVVQVENGNSKVTTKTSLLTCMKILKETCNLPNSAFAHCFEGDADEQVGMIQLRKVEASKIQDNPDVAVVFFKTALSTGWDCPRAEVMMSFRKAVDATLIAQLVGRMVRTPLARRVESNEFLNGVSLALPHYDEEGVATIIKRLQDPETGATGEVVKESEIASYGHAPNSDELFSELAKVPTYVVDRPRRIAETARLRKLAGMLSRNGLGNSLVDHTIRFIVEQLLKQRDRLGRDADWAARLDGTSMVPVKEFTIEYGEWKVKGAGQPYLIAATEDNILGLFERCGSVLGEGLHESYANRPDFHGDINAARLELFCILQDEKALKLVQQACERQFEHLWNEHKEDVALLSPPAHEKFKDLRRRGGTAVSELLTIVDKIEVKKESSKWNQHIFTDTKGSFGWAAGPWERIVLQAEMVRSGFAGFLRNVPRKEWALCIPYGSLNDKPMYPDLLVFRRTKSGVQVDIFEPHGDHLADHVAKAKGMAQYAKNHGDGLGRIEMIRIVKDKPERLNLQDEKIRSKVLLATTAEQLEDLYKDFG